MPPSPPTHPFRSSANPLPPNYSPRREPLPPRPLRPLVSQHEPRHAACISTPDRSALSHVERASHATSSRRALAGPRRSTPPPASSAHRTRRYGTPHHTTPDCSDPYSRLRKAPSSRMLACPGISARAGHISHGRTAHGCCTLVCRTVRVACSRAYGDA